MFGTTQIHIRYNKCGKYVNWFSLLVCVQMLEYLCSCFNNANNSDKVGKLLWHLRGSHHHLVDEANDLMILMNLRGNERFNLTVTYSVHEVCMRGTRITSLIGQFFLVETYFVQHSQSKFGEYYI